MNEKEGRMIREQHAAEQTIQAINIFPATTRFEYSIESEEGRKSRIFHYGILFIPERLLAQFCLFFIKEHDMKYYEKSYQRILV